MPPVFADFGAPRGPEPGRRISSVIRESGGTHWHALCSVTSAMPLLKREPDVFPETLFESRFEAPWVVAHVRSRQEKVLARFLAPAGIPFYAPQREKRTRRN